MLRWTRNTLLFVALAAAASGCATNPVTGKRELSLVSAGQEQQMGLEGYKAVVQEYGLYDDRALQDYVNTVGQKVAKVSHLPTLEWHFTLLDDPTVNAFAMPGGYIYVTRGILAHLNSEAQLAGVLGHECGHVTHRHTAEQITQQQLYGLGFGLASALSPTFRQYGQVAQQALGLLFLKYSRADETEADQLGVEYATKAGYDPREIPKTYQMLARVGAASGQRLPSYLSTHPDPGDRETRTAELSRAAAAGKSGLIVNGPGFVQRLNGIVFGPDPRQGYFDGDTYYNPSLRFQMTFPSGWQHQDSKSAVMAGLEQQAMLQVTLADAGTASPAAYVSQLGTKGAISGAEGGDETIGGFPAWVGHLRVPQQNGQTSILDAAFVRRSDGQMFQMLGQTAAAGDANEAKLFSSMRSFRALTDPARLDVTPDHVRVDRVPATGQFQTVLARLGAPTASLAQDVVLNNVDAQDNVVAGALVKYVVPGRH